MNCAVGASVSRPKAAQDAVDRTIENSLERPRKGVHGVVSRLFAAAARRSHQLFIGPRGSAGAEAPFCLRAGRYYASK